MNSFTSIEPTDAAGLSSLVSIPAGSDAVAELASARLRVEQILLRETEAMVLYALGAGLDLPPEALASPQPPGPDAEMAARPDRLVRLAALHLSLTRLIAPARGATLVLLAEQRQRHPFLTAFGPVPQMRWMLAAAVFSLVLLLGVALSGDVNEENVSKGLLNLQGIPLVLVEIFLVAASAVGATLANLKRLNRFISDCTYDPRYDGSYWTRLVMGLISGVILSQVVFGTLISGEGPAAPSAAHTALLGFGQPILAILGGFSAELVHDILTHLIGVIGNALGIRKGS